MQSKWHGFPFLASVDLAGFEYPTNGVLDQRYSRFVTLQSVTLYFYKEKAIITTMGFN